MLRTNKRQGLPDPRKQCRGISACAVVLVTFLLAQSLNAERLPVRTYTIADGLPRDSVTRIVKDSRGFLWFCTGDGVSRFDGYGFSNFTTDDGLPERHVNDVFEFDPETLFFATDGGLARLNPRGIRGHPDDPLFSVFVPPDHDARSFRQLLRESDDTFLAATDAGLYRVRVTATGGVAFEHIPITGEAALRRPEVMALYRDSKGAVWAGSFGWIARVAPDGTSHTFDSGSGVPRAGITTFVETRSGQFWAGTRDMGGLLFLNPEASPNDPLVTSVVTMDDGLPSNWISDVLLASDGRTLVATPHGLCDWNDDSGSSKSVCRRVYDDANGLCEYVSSAFEDDDGNFWVAGACGVKRIARYGFTSYAMTDGLGFSFPETLFESSAGDLIAASRNDGRFLSRFTGERFDLLNLEKSVESKRYGWGWKQTAMEDSLGDWWVASGTALLRYPRPASFLGLATADPERMEAWPGEAFRIYEDSRGDVWVGTFGGPRYALVRWRRTTGKWEDLTDEAGMTPVSLVSGFIEDRLGNLWITTGIDNGREGLLIRYRDGKFRAFNEKEGVPAGWMRDVYLDSKGRLWLANTSVGLLRLVDPAAEDRLDFVRYGRGQGLASNGIFCVVEDNLGRIYAGSGRGIDRLDVETGVVRNFTTSDGLPGNQVEVALRDRNGDLWFSAQGGLARLRPEPLRPREPPKALISGVRTPTGGPRSISILGETSVEPVTLAAHEGAISVDFIGLGPTLGEKLRYEYRLGGENAWTATNERTINIADLAAGEFLLEVRAVTSDGVTGEPATVSFAVTAPIWQRWWFIALSVIAIGFVVYFYYRNRLNRFLQLERMRTRIATDLHDDIGANLTRISLLSEVAKQRTTNGASDLLTSIAEISRESVASMNDIVWAISPDHDRLVDLVRRMRSHAEEVFTLRDIELDFSAPVTDADLHLSVGVRRDLLLIFKEAVNNAARHSDCTRVKIDFRSSGHLLVLEVADNGKGFAAVGQDGQGLRSMKRRAKALGGNLDVRSAIDEGTTLRFEMSLAKAPAV